MNENLSKLTTIPKAALDKLDEKREYIICDEVLNSVLNYEEVTTIDIGIGKLLICLDEDSLGYKFIPSSSLEEALIDVVTKKNNPLIDALEKAISSRIVNTYKDLF